MSSSALCGLRSAARLQDALGLTERALAELLTINGFQVTEKHGGFLPYTMSEGNNPPLWMVKLYLRIKLAWNNQCRH